MENPATTESDKCRRLAAAMRLDATRATMHGFADRLIKGAEDLEEMAGRLIARDCVLASVFH